MDSMIMELLYTACYVLGLTGSIMYVYNLSLKTKPYIILYFLAYSIILNTMTSFFIEEVFLYVIFNILCMVTDYLYCIILVKKFRPNVIFISILYYCLYGTLVMIVSYQIMNMSNTQYFDVIVGNFRAYVPIIASSIAFLVCAVSNRKQNFIDQELPKKHITSYFLIHFFMGVILTILNLVLATQYSILVMLVIFILVFQLIVTNRYIIQTNTLYVKNKELALTNYSQEIMLKHVKEVEEKNNENSKFRHDIMNHLSILLQINNNETVENYIATLTDELLKNKLYQTGNIFIDAILNNKIKDDDIEYIVHVNVKEQLHIKEGKLCSLLCNLIDNAIEATKQTKEKKVEIHIDSRNNMLIISIVNNVNEEPSFLSKKGDGHGYGLFIIHEIVDEYNGSIQYIYNDKKLVTNIIINEEI